MQWAVFAVSTVCTAGVSIVPSSLAGAPPPCPPCTRPTAASGRVRSVPTKAAFSPFGSGAVLSGFSLPVAGSMRKLASVLLVRSDANRNFFCGSTAERAGRALDRERLDGGELAVLGSSRKTWIFCSGAIET